MHSTTPAFWIDFLSTEYALAKTTNGRTWQAIPYSLSAAEYEACVTAAQSLGFPLLRASKTQRYLKLELRCTRTKGKK